MKNKDKKSKNIQNKSTGREIISASFSGPIPPPNLLADYEKILPGSADRIISMAEKQSNHRQEIEKTVISSNVRNEKVGMWLAFILTLCLMIFGGYLILNDKEVVGYFAVFGPIIFHAGNYVYNKHKENSPTEKE